MIMAAVALLSALGAWFTWRRNPLYSVQRTLKVLGTTVLLLGVTTGVMVLAVRYTEGRSLPVQIAALALTIILCCWALILGISAVSTPAAARMATSLPPNVPLETQARLRLVPWLRRFGVALAGLLVLMLIPGPVRYIAGAMAALSAGLALIMLPVGYVTALRADRAVTALKLHPWVHWRYGADIWSGWVARESQLQAHAEMPTMTPALRRRTFLILTLFGIGYAAWVVPGSWQVRLSASLVTGAVVFGASLLARSDPQRAAQRIARRMQAEAPESFFGHDGVLCNGEFCAWLGTDVYLLSASLETGPPRCIELWFEKVLPGGYGGAQLVKLQRHVLVAADAASTDLPVLQAALVARCPSARITLA